MTWPVVYVPRIKYRYASVASSGDPALGTACRSVMAATRSGGIDASASVAMRPGHTAFTRTGGEPSDSKSGHQVLDRSCHRRAHGSARTRAMGDESVGQRDRSARHDRPMGVLGGGQAAPEPHIEDLPGAIEVQVVNTSTTHRVPIACGVDEVVERADLLEQRSDAACVSTSIVAADGDAHLQWQPGEKLRRPWPGCWRLRQSRRPAPHTARRRHVRCPTCRQ